MFLQPAKFHASFIPWTIYHQAAWLFIINGNTLLQAQMSLPDTFRKLSESVFAQLPNVRRVDFVTDSYNPFSIKWLERTQDGEKTMHIEVEELCSSQE